MRLSQLQTSPVILFLTSITLLMAFPIDFWLADLLYSLEGGSWSLRDTWVTESLIHVGGRKFSVAMAIFLLGVIGLSHFNMSIRPYRTGLVYIFIAALMSTSAVILLKEISHRDCPWDLIRYGGDNPIFSWFSYGIMPDIKTGACFPAGHASAGYCWFGLYFFAKNHFPKWQVWAFMLPLSMGLVFGFDQQLRGAHFLSHDIWSAWISWFFAATLNLMFKVPNSRPLRLKA